MKLITLSQFVTGLFSIRFSRTLAIVLLGMLSYSDLQAQTINAKQKDVIIIDNGQSGKADPADRIRYDVTIENTGGPNGNNTQLNIVPDPRTTFLPGSFRSSPLALDDAYASTGNVGITVPAASGLIANDFDDNIPALTVSSGTFATTGGGSITINADGSFTYNPPAGLTGGATDSYTYTLNDGNPIGGGIPSTNTATVTFTLNNLIWFIDNTGGGSGGTGTLANPFKLISNFNASSGPAINQLVFIKHTGTNYSGPLNLKNGQIVFGTGYTGGANLSNVLPFGLAPNSNVLPAINGTRPIIANGLGDAIVLATDNTLRGIDAGNAGGFAIIGNGTTAGNLIISEVSINNTTAGGFKAANGSNSGMNVVFTSLTSAGGNNGINLTNTAGTFTVNGGTITNSVAAVLISGGTVTFSSSGNIVGTGGFAIDIDNHDSNNITFSGNITAGGSGIRVQNCGGGTITFSGASKSVNTGGNAAVTLSTNSGATITFSGGGLVITTTSGAGFNATGGATAINVTGSNNTISSGTGTALNVNNTTIGASNITFKSISSSGSLNGIVLSTTGLSGGLVVTGDGGGSNNGSGGTIQNTTDNGINLLSTANASLGYMNINTSGNEGILVQNNTNLTINRCNLINNGNSTSDDGIQIGNTTGTAINGVTGNLTIDNTVISGSAHNNIHIRNVSGTLSNMSITGSSFNNLNDITGANAFLFEASNTAVITSATLTSCTFSNNSPQRALEVQSHDAANIQSFTVQTSTFDQNGIHMSFTQDGGASHTFKILNNTSMLNSNPLQAINVFSSATSTGGTFQGRIEGNIIGNNAVAGSGSTAGGGIRIFMQGLTRGIFLINNNQIYECPNGRGIELTSGSFATNGVDATITNNTIDHVNLTYSPGSSNFPLAAIYMVADNPTGSGNGTLRADVRSNTINIAGGSYDYPTFDGNAPWLYYYEEPGLGNSILLDVAPTGAASANAEIIANNPAVTSKGAAATVSLITGSISTPP